MHFLVFATDAAGTSELRKRLRPSHREYLRDHDAHRVKVCLGGPTLSADQTDMNGTLLVVEADNAQDVSAFVADDPYSRAGLFAKVEVRPWSWSLGNPETRS